MTKKHLVVLTNKQNVRLQNIKTYIRLNNVNRTFENLIDNFGDVGFKEYLEGK